MGQKGVPCGLGSEVMIEICEPTKCTCLYSIESMYHIREYSSDDRDMASEEVDTLDFMNRSYKRKASTKREGLGFLAVEFKCLNSLSIRNMVVFESDLQLLAKTRGGDLRSLEIRGCQMFSEDGLLDIARYCVDLRSLSLAWNAVYSESDGKWLHELALRNSVMESLYFNTPFDGYVMEDVELLANKCSNSLVFLNVVPEFLTHFQNVLKHAKKLDHIGYGIMGLSDEDLKFTSFEIPSNIHALRIQNCGKASFPFILPYLNQLRELVLECPDMEGNCQCLLFESCPNLEVLATEDICGDIGCQVIGKFCKKLRKLTHHGLLTHMGLIALAQGCHNLDYLDVNLKDISNEALECVGTHLKNLRDFRNFLVSEESITDSPLDSGVRAMLMGCSKLKRLHISVCPGGLTDMGLGYIGKYGHNLRSLFLSCTGEFDAGLLDLSKGCPKLRKLELTDCPFSEEAIANFVFNIHSLRYVRVKSGHDTVLALTRPTVPAEVLTELKPYTILAEKLHRLAVQLAAYGSGVGLVKMTCTSSRAMDALDTEGIRINEERVILDRPYEKPLEIIKVKIANVESRFTTAISESGEIVVGGSVKDGVPHLTKVGAFEVNVSLEGNIILCRQFDQPNTIGSVTSILGEENLNISSMSVGSTRQRKQAVMVIGVDEKPSKEALKKIDEIPAVEEFWYLLIDHQKSMICFSTSQFIPTYLDTNTHTARVLLNAAVVALEQTEMERVHSD
ncbi:hypothetical protein CTI12_AA058880 [Artemisia annua]|uniref:ACT domain-containing protein n=1 Tax=Artemisia annua TaxID=35608 RepID=A0A2U1Q1N8_ARTAN|nr:hypothetical protein CTI12_AA058880 [Artemisia annua]